jgi:hypothetical protein
LNIAHGKVIGVNPLKIEFTSQVPAHWGLFMVVIDQDKALARKNGDEWIVIHPREMLLSNNVALADMNVDKLKEYAETRNIKIPSKIRRKEEIRLFIQEHL